LAVLDAAVNPLVCLHAAHALQILPIRIITQDVGDKNGSYGKKTGNHVFRGAREDRAQTPQRVEEHTWKSPSAIKSISWR